jgi:hypothetical protein
MEIIHCVPFSSSAHKRAGQGDKKRNSGNTRAEFLPKSCSLASRCHAKTLVVVVSSRMNPTHAALRVLESDRPPIKSLALRVCASAGFFGLCFVVVKRRIRVTIARGHHTAPPPPNSMCLHQCAGISCLSLQRSAIFGLGCLRHYAHIHVRTGCQGCTSTADNHFACAPLCGCLARTHAAVSNCRRKMRDVRALTCTNAGKRR